MPAKPRYIASCELDLPKRTAKDLLSALRPEADGQHPETRTDMTVSGDSMVLVISSDGLSGLRAALNSQLRWVDCACKVHRLPEEEA